MPGYSVFQEVHRRIVEDRTQDSDAQFERVFEMGASNPKACALLDIADKAFFRPTNRREFGTLPHRHSA